MSSSLQNYIPGFSAREATEHILGRLQALDRDKPDPKSLLTLISELVSIMNGAKFDYVVLNNLMAENEKLVEDRSVLELQQISQNVAHMGLKLNAITRQCEALQIEIDRPDYPWFKTVMPVPTKLKGSSETFETVEYLAVDLTLNLQIID